MLLPCDGAIASVMTPLDAYLLTKFIFAIIDCIITVAGIFPVRILEHCTELYIIILERNFCNAVLSSLIGYLGTERNIVGVNGNNTDAICSPLFIRNGLTEAEVCTINGLILDTKVTFMSF